jgi:pimeloyl-ACP methyl ester carboxylesterase
VHQSHFDPKKIAFYGRSWGGRTGLIISAVEDRVAVNILEVGGVWSEGLPEAHAINYASHVKIPTLMLNGRFDSGFPLETDVRPAFELLSTPDPKKRLVVYDTDHYVPRQELVKESLAWLDGYLDPVE